MSDAVARYYDRNTRRFLWLGPGRDTPSIHRELWGPGVASAKEAATYIDGLIAARITERLRAGTRDGPGHPDAIVDFGCGVGGTLLYLARRFPRAQMRGVTISGRQVEMGSGLMDRAGVGERVRIERGDFHEADLDVRADAVVAIESLAHSADRKQFLTNAARHLRAGGLLLVGDDFLAKEIEQSSPVEQRYVARFRRGWRVPGLCTVDRLVDEAAGAGLSLQHDEDLTELTRPGSRIRDRLVALTAPLADRLGLATVPFFGNVIGGHALQVGLARGFIRYRLVVFERSAPEG